MNVAGAGMFRLLNETLQDPRRRLLGIRRLANRNGAMFSHFASGADYDSRQGMATRKTWEITAAAVSARLL